MPRPSNPDDYRMTIGEHLEELRWRLLLGIGGFGLVFIVCLIFGNQVFLAFCKPLYDQLERLKLNPQLHYQELGEGFLVWIQVNLITAAAIASPWLLYQLWQFIAAGLYPHEQKYVTRYAPLSITLLIAGMLFVYYLVLPWTIVFFLDFANSIPLPQAQTATTQKHDALILPRLRGNPQTPQDNEIWVDETTGQIKIFFDGAVRSIRFSSQNLLAPDIRLSEYIDLVTGMLIMFGLSFQMPLVVLALARVGIVDVDQLRAMRRYIYLAITILAAAITPGDVITATILLMVPLVLLYELGIWMAARSAPTKVR